MTGGTIFNVPLISRAITRKFQQEVINHGQAYMGNRLHFLPPPQQARSRTMKIHAEELESFLELMFAANRPVHVSSRPGSGKSKIAEALPVSTAGATARSTARRTTSPMCAAI